MHYAMVNGLGCVDTACWFGLVLADSGRLMRGICISVAFLNLSIAQWVKLGGHVDI